MLIHSSACTAGVDPVPLSSLNGGGEIVALDETVDQPIERQKCVIAGRYVVLDIIAEGNSGRVLLANDRVLRRQVAVKIPRTGPEQDSAAKFLHEARAAAGIQHPGIVTVHDFGQEPDGSVFLVEDFIDGQSLASVIKSDSLDCVALALLLADVSEAVHAAHVCGLIHRDVKPANILIDRNGRAFVTDFGLALIVGSHAGDERRISGTPAYMSPEQTFGEIDQLDTRSDVWSVGVILYELLTGRRPFLSESIPILFEQISEQDVTAPTALRPDIPHSLEQICLRCLEKQPEDRFPDARLLAVALRDAAAELSSDATPAGTEPFRDRAILASATVAVLTFAGFGLMTAMSTNSVPVAAVANVPPSVSRSVTGAIPAAARRQPAGSGQQATMTARRLSTQRPGSSSLDQSPMRGGESREAQSHSDIGSGPL
jgi:serine/threonine protein kinase